MQTSPSDREPGILRTLEQLQEHHQMFEDSGSKEERAKDISFNVLARTIIPVPVDHVSYINYQTISNLYLSFQRISVDTDINQFFVR